MEQKGKILVTGANGFLATNIVNALLESGYQVRGLLRRKNSYAGPGHPGLELAEGSFTDETALSGAMEGCTAVIHSAACTSQSATEEDYRRINVEGVRTVFGTAVRSGIGRVVYISSANIFGYGTEDAPGDESSPIRFPFTLSGYAVSKSAAQKVVDEFRDRLDIITLCPTFMLGPYGSRAGSCRIVLMCYRKKITFCPPGGKNFVAVKDVAKAATDALVQGVPGEAYLIAGENLSYKEFYGIMSEMTGTKSVRIGLPASLMLFLGRIGDILASAGLKTELSTANMRLLCIKNYYTAAKAAAGLGFHARPVREAVADTVSWFRRTGVLK